MGKFIVKLTPKDACIYIDCFHINKIYRSTKTTYEYRNVQPANG